MTSWAIEINDAGLELAGSDGQLHCEPGMALSEGRTLHLGEAARARARMLPRNLDSRFWMALLGANGETSRAASVIHSELAYAQLARLWNEHRTGRDDLILVVPPGAGADDLGRLLGVAQAAGLPARALVSSALATGLGCPPESPAELYLDAGLHHTSVSWLERHEGVRECATLRHDAFGLEALLEAWLRAIALRFVERTRFDPLHTAHSEQQLYDRLPDWLSGLFEEPVLELQLHVDGALHQAEWTCAESIDVARPHYALLSDQIAAARNAWSVQLGAAGNPVPSLILSHRLASLPGLAAFLREHANLHVRSSQAHAAVCGALGQTEALCSPDGQVHLIRSFAFLPANASKEVKGAASRAPGSTELRARSARANATHVLHAGLAYAISETPFQVGSAPPQDGSGLQLPGRPPGISRRHCTLVRDRDQLILRDLSRHGTFVNETRVHGETTLCCGDRVRVGAPGVELQAIALAKSHGS